MLLLAQIAKWILDNPKFIAGLILVAGVTIGLGMIHHKGVLEGRAEVQARWDAQKAADAKALAEAQAKAASDAMQAYQDLDAKLAHRSASTAKLMKGLKDALDKKDALPECHTGADSLRYYNSIVAPNG